MEHERNQNISKDTENLSALSVIQRTARSFKNLIEDILKDLETHNDLILDLQDLDFIDASGIHALEMAYEELQAKNMKFFMCHLKEQPAKTLKNHALFGEKSGVVQKKLSDVIAQIQTH